LEAPITNESVPMSKKSRRPLILVVSVVLVIIAIVGAFAYTSLLNPSRSAPQQSWHEVGTYSGAVTNYNDVSQNTTVFQIHGSQLRVHWEFTMCCDSAYDQTFSLMLYSNHERGGLEWLSLH
jgi:flagellar basal body-associated protein FliL